MSKSISANTQAILLLTAPLIAGRGESSADLLTHTEYKTLARFLRDAQRQPSDLLAPDAAKLFAERQSFIDSERLKRLLARGFLLAQAVERWQTRAIWVMSRADSEYPKRLKARLKEDSPPLLYGVGDAGILDTGGLAVVGSRHVDDALVEYAEGIGALAANARRTVVSGAARGIDQAAMRGALNAGGKVVGVAGDSLERAALDREHRSLLMDGKLVFISPYDPAAGFNVGHAMQRNKLIYALADAALVVSSDYEKGGTWTGALEQLEKLRLVPLYVRSIGRTEKGLEALCRRGALLWPNPVTPAEFVEVIETRPARQDAVAKQDQLLLPTIKESSEEYRAQAIPLMDITQQAPAVPAVTPSEELFAKVKLLLEEMSAPKTDAEVAIELGVLRRQAKEWLERLVKEGVLEKVPKPTRYRSASSSR